MYQTLYRKYRPSNFDEVAGQEIIIRTIKNAIKNNKLTHAYLFCGPRGTGKTSIAKIIAKTINCSNLVNLMPCNNCVNCTQFNNKQSVDIIEIDAASNNGVDEIRELRNNVNLVPTTGKYKIYIIDEVHMLTIGAFNALLKTLEEPPAHIIFILATTEPHKIPNTIMSRCQKFEFKKIGVNKIVERLKYVIENEKIDIEEEAILEIARLADGGLRDALSILDQVNAYSNETITVELIHEINGTIPQYQLKKLVINIKEKNYNEIFELIDNYDNDGKNFIKLTEEIITFFRNILLILNAKEFVKNNLSNYEIYEELENMYSEEDIIKYIKIFTTQILDMKKSNNPKLMFETMIIQLLNNNESNIQKEKILVVKEEKNNIQKENKKLKIEEPKEEIDYEFLNKLKDIRINNTLCEFNKKELIEFKTRIDDIRVMLMDPKYSEITLLILEGEVKAAGNKHIIFVFKEERYSISFNQQIKLVEELFEKVYKDSFKLISTNLNEWNIIKDEFNNKKKKYEYIEEPPLEKIYKNMNNKIDKEFEEIIEYN